MVGWNISIFREATLAGTARGTDFRGGANWPAQEGGQITRGACYTNILALQAGVIYFLERELMIGGD